MLREDNVRNCTDRKKLLQAHNYVFVVEARKSIFSVVLNEHTRYVKLLATAIKLKLGAIEVLRFGARGKKVILAWLAVFALLNFCNVQRKREIQVFETRSRSEAIVVCSKKKDERTKQKFGRFI